MRYRTPLLSLAAGLFTPLPLLVALNAMHAATARAGEPPLGWQAALCAAFFAALAVALAKPISPGWYGSALIAATPIWYATLGGADRGSNLFGLALMMIAVAGVTVGVAAGLCATLIRHWPTPWWTPLVPLAAAALLVPFARLSAVRGESVDNARAARLLQQIARAENEYAASQPDHAYTCDGPSLPLGTPLEWRATPSLGTVERSQAQYAPFWIQLRCDASAHPAWFTATPVASWQSGPRLTYDSRENAIRLR